MSTVETDTAPVEPEQPIEQLLLEVAGFLTLLARGIVVPNLRQQADELLEKIGRALPGEKA